LSLGNPFQGCFKVTRGDRKKKLILLMRDDPILAGVKRCFFLWAGKTKLGREGGRNG